MRIALEVEHRVDDVFRARGGPASAPSFVTWPTMMIVTPSCLATRVNCAAHSRTCATEPGAEVSAIRVDRLDRVDHGDLGPLGVDRRLDPFKLDLGEQAQFGRARARFREAQTLRAQRDLCTRFFAAHIERLALTRHRREGLEQQRRLADPGVAADQHDAALDQPAAKHPVELADARREARHVGRLDLRELAHGRTLRERLETMPAAGRLGNGLDQRVPCVAGRALALPF